MAYNLHDLHEGFFYPFLNEKNLKIQEKPLEKGFSSLILKIKNHEKIKK